MLYTGHTSLLQMKKYFLSILCTAYCNTIMPQIENNVGNICNTGIMKVVIVCMKSSLKKRLITVPVSRFYHTIIISPTTALTMTSRVFAHWRVVNHLSLNSNKKKGGKCFLSVPFTFMHSLCFLSEFVHTFLCW